MVLILSLVAAALNTAIVIKSASSPGAHPATMVFPGASGPSARAFLEDFPNAALPDGIGHDGQQFYAIARQPLRPNSVAPHLDRPRYRLQRIAFPLISFLLHPQGGGRGLVAAMVVVGALSLVAGGLATGMTSTLLGGPSWPAAVFALLPGALIGMRLSTADNLAVAAALGAVAFSLANWHRFAVCSGVLATLAKESSWILLLGFAMWRRDRQGFRLAAIPALVAGTWWIALRLMVVDHSPGITEFTIPFMGLVDSILYWVKGRTVFACYLVPFSFAAGNWVVVKSKLRHPLAPAILLQLIFSVFLNLDVLALDANGSRVTMPILLLSIVALATHTGRRYPH